MIFIQDTLLGFKYSKEVLAAVPKSQGLGCFLELDIGNGYGFAEEAGKRGYPLFRAHPMWKDDHRFSSKDLPVIVSRAKKYDAIAARYPGTKWYISTGCEHRLSATEAKKFFDAVTLAAPHCIVVNCPLPEGAALPGVINEVHGKAKPRSPSCAYSADGESIVDMDATALKKTFANAAYFGFWDPQYNLRAESDDTTPRLKRKLKPSVDLIKSLVALAGEKGATSVPKNWILKSHAEKQLTPDARSDKPVYIIPLKAPKIELQKGGKVIATLNYYGPFSGGGHRYYASRMGFQIATEPVELWVNGKKFAVVNPTFRDGVTRG